MRAQGQGIRTTRCETALPSGTARDYSTAGFTGSIGHSHPICEENYEEIIKNRKNRASPGELKTKTGNGCLAPALFVRQPVDGILLRCLERRITPPDNPAGNRN